jgi:hypothetical protein
VKFRSGQKTAIADFIPQSGNPVGHFPEAHFSPASQVPAHPAQSDGLSGTIKSAMSGVPDIPGAADVVAWFGHWPTFHDAEVLSITLDRSGESRVAIHTFERTPDVDSSGHYVLAKHAVITFCLEGFPQDKDGITNTRVEFFNHQNVLGNASLNKTINGYELVLQGIYGVQGEIASERVSVRLEPGKPGRGISQP